jgi:hypothetical protein
VNKISSESGKMTPYAFMVGVSPSGDVDLSPVPSGMKDDEIIVSRWLADALGVAEGSAVSVDYFVLGPANALLERTREFRVRSVAEMKTLRSERDFAPTFPGLTDVESCKNWDVGMPMDEELLADELNQAYWEEYGPTPKAIVTLAAAQSMWANRFGELSQIRAPADRESGLVTRLKNMNPAELGLVFLPVRELALRGVEESMSFGELFVSMSFFLIIAAIVLTGLLFVLGIQQRSAQAGVLKALGYRRGQVLRLFILEGATLAALGCLVGALLAPLYTQALIWGLATQWKGAVAGSAIQFHQEPATLVSGTLAAFLTALITLVIAVWRQGKLPARALIAGEAVGYEKNAPETKTRHPILSSVSLLIALALVATSARADTHQLVMIFFGAGFLLLLSGIGYARYWLKGMANSSSRWT